MKEDFSRTKHYVMRAFDLFTRYTHLLCLQLVYLTKLQDSEIQVTGTSDQKFIFFGQDSLL